MTRVLLTLVLAAALAACGARGDGDPGATVSVRPRPAAPSTTTTTPAPSLPGLAAQDAAVRRLAARGLPIHCGGGRRRIVALTFDDGPGRRTGTVLELLAEAGARATFFLVGTSIEEFGWWPRRQRERGAIATHSMTHANPRTLPFAEARAEIADGRAAALRAAGAPVELYRPPYGARTPALDREVRRQGLAQILWDVDSTDSRNVPPATVREISLRVRRHAQPGSIVLMHENRAPTIRALRAILPALERRGLRLVTVPELLAADPPSTAQLEGGVKACRAGPAARRR